MSPEDRANLETKINHSGNAPQDIRETPVNEFDNTSLKDAVEMYHTDKKGNLIVPETAAPLIETPENKPKKRLLLTLGASAAGVALVAGGFFGVKAAMDSNSHNAPEKDPKATSEPSTTSTPEATKAPEQELTVKSLEIPTGLSPEELGKTFVQDRLSQWEMAGATPENQKEWILADDTKSYLESLAEKNGNIFADALFIPDWQSDPHLIHEVDFEKGQNASSVENWFKTYDDPGSDEAYKRSVSVDSTTVVSQTEGAITLKVLATEHNNSVKNRASEFDPNATSNNGAKFLATVTFTTVGGVEKISALTMGNPE